jgi:hypothetical protein
MTSTRHRLLTFLPAAALVLAACAKATDTSAESAATTAAPTTAAPTTAAPTTAALGGATELLESFVTAINADDLNSYTGLFAPDAVFVDSGRTFTGTAQIRDFGASLIDDRSSYTIVRLTGDDERAEMVFDYVAGVGGWYRLNDATGEVTAAAGLIRTMRLD